MRRDEITCSVKGCGATHKETAFNQGHPSWGEVVGIIDAFGEQPHICPKCMSDIKAFLDTGRMKNGMD